MWTTYVCITFIAIISTTYTWYGNSLKVYEGDFCIKWVDYFLLVDKVSCLAVSYIVVATSSNGVVYQKLNRICRVTQSRVVTLILSLVYSCSPSYNMCMTVNCPFSRPSVHPYSIILVCQPPPSEDVGGGDLLHWDSSASPLCPPCSLWVSQATRLLVTGEQLQAFCHAVTVVTRCYILKKAFDTVFCYVETLLGVCNRYREQSSCLLR